MHELLALFPLQTVLFPGELLPLRIFEERYKQMIGQCLARQEPFGVVLIHSGVEAFGELAQPHSVGTAATIIDSIKFEDGQYYIATQGGPRFRVHEIVQDAPYLVAAVEFLEDDVDSECQVQADHLRRLYERYRTAVPIITSCAEPLADLPLDPVELSFRLSDQLQVTDESKQHLLEADLETRLEALTAALEGELRLLPPVSNPPKDHPEIPWSLN